jgi:hypothetical protein
MDTMMENWVGIEDDPAIQDSDIEEVLKELEVGKEEDIDDDANSTRKDPMVVDDSDSDDNDSSLGFKSHLEIEEAFRTTLSFAKKKMYPKKVQDLIEKSTKEITKRRCELIVRQKQREHQTIYHDLL